MHLHGKLVTGSCITPRSRKTHFRLLGNAYAGYDDLKHADSGKQMLNRNNERMNSIANIYPGSIVANDHFSPLTVHFLP
jgi:hypothetical protein